MSCYHRIVGAHLVGAHKGRPYRNYILILLSRPMHG